MGDVVVAGKATQTPEANEKLKRVLAGIRAEHAEELSEAEAASEEETDADAEDEAVEDTREEQPVLGAGVPEWFTLPSGVTVEAGAAVRFMRIPAKYTARPKGPERQCMLSPLTIKDERLALQRAATFAKNDTTGKLTMDELAKQCIRVVDGKKADWSGRPTAASVNQFWADLGRVRARIVEWYLRTHTMDAKEKLDFFEHCIEDRAWGE